MCQHHTTTPYTQLSVVGLVLCSVPGVLWWYTPQCCVHLLLCRPKRPLPNPVYEYEYMGSGSGGVALTNMTKNPAYMTAGETVTGFSSGPEEDKEKDHTYEVLPFEANEEMVQEDTAHGGGGEAADDVHVYVNQ